MGNTLGIDCSMNYVHVTNILINEKNKRKNVKKINYKCNICFPDKNILDYDNIKSTYSLNNLYKKDVKKNKEAIEKKFLNLETHIIKENNLEKCMKKNLHIKGYKEEICNETCENNEANIKVNYIVEDIKKKEEEENGFHKNESNNQIMNNYINNKERILKIDSRKFPEDLEKNNEVHNNTNNLGCDNYMKMQKDLLEYILDAQHIIEDTIQIIILKEEAENSQSEQFSLKELCKQFKGNEDLNKKFHIYTKFIKSNMNCNLEKDKTDNCNINNEKNKNNDEIAQIYFWSLKLKRVNEFILKYSKYIKNVLINITGKNSNYIKKKFIELTEINNIYVHKEINCINSSICFLKEFYPKDLYHFVNTETSDVKNTNNSNNNNENKLTKCFLNKKEASEIGTYLIVNIKRAVSYHLVNEENLIKRIGNCLFGCKSILGLFLLLTGKLCSLEIICKLAKKGINKTFDMTVEDIYGSSYNEVGLRGYVTASFFGKTQNIDYINYSLNSSNKEIYSNIAEDILGDKHESLSSLEYFSFESNSEESDEYDNNRKFSIFLKNKNNYVNYLNINDRNNMLKNSLFNFYSDSCYNYRNVVIKEKKILQKKKKINIKHRCKNNCIISETVTNKKGKCIKHDTFKKENNDYNYKEEIKDYEESDSNNNLIMRKVQEKNNKELLYISINKKEGNIFLMKSSSDSELKVNKHNELNYLKKKGKYVCNNFELYENEYKKEQNAYSIDNGVSIKELNNTSMKKIISNNDEQIIKKKLKGTNNSCVKRSFKKRKNINKNLIEIISTRENHKLNNFLKVDSINKKNQSNSKITDNVKFNSRECDIAKSLLSMVIFTIVQLSYLHSHIYNVKSIIFSGLILDNDICLSLVKIIINIMSSYTEKLYFFKYSKHLSSLGSALHLIDWNNFL